MSRGTGSVKSSIPGRLSFPFLITFMIYTYYRVAAGERVKRLKTETTELAALFGDISLLERFMIFATRSHSLIILRNL